MMKAIWKVKDKYLIVVSALLMCIAAATGSWVLIGKMFAPAGHAGAFDDLQYSAIGIAILGLLFLAFARFSTTEKT